MTDPRETLKHSIKMTLEGIKDLSVDDAADLLNEVADELSERGPEDLFHGAILDGIRWGYTAAWTVEVGGGAILRTIMPGGGTITHEWADEADAQPQIKAALLALHSARQSGSATVTASNVGDGEQKAWVDAAEVIIAALGEELEKVRARAEAAEAALAAEKAKTARLVEVLRDIAAQKLATEIQTCADEEQFGDFEGGYDAIITVARAAIAEVQG